MKIAGLMPIGGNQDKFKAESIKQLHSICDTTIVLQDREDAPIVATLMSDESITLDHDEPWNDYGNRLMLLSRAAARGCDWVMWLDHDDVIDAAISRFDITQMILGCEVDKIMAIRFCVREMWNETHWRADGRFANKSRIVLQKNPLLLPSVVWKNHWNPHSMPVQEGPEFQSWWELFHWGMSTPELRKARVAKHEAADPEGKWQDDYRYLEKTEGLELVRA